MMGIVIGTAILWILSAAFVTPLATYFLKRKLQQPAYAHLQGESVSEADQSQLQRLATRTCILADVLVLGTAGIIAGLLGFWFVGISFNAKGWPGMLAFIIPSVLLSGALS